MQIVHSLKGLVTGKHEGERISKHENSQNHREAMAIMSTRQTSIGRIDSHICLLIENERQYWRKVLEGDIYEIQFLGERD